MFSRDFLRGGPCLFLAFNFFDKNKFDNFQKLRQTKRLPNKILKKNALAIFRLLLKNTSY